MSLLLICEILGDFVNTLTADEKYSLPNSKTLRETTEMQLCKIQMTCSKFPAPFVKSSSNFKHFEKKMILIADIFPKLRSAKNVVRYMPNQLRFRTLFANQHVRGSQTL